MAAARSTLRFLAAAGLAGSLLSSGPSGAQQTPARAPEPAVRPAATEPQRPKEPLISDEAIREAIADIGKLVDIEAERAKLPDEAWFSRDKKDADGEIAALLAELNGVVGNSEALKHWTEMRNRQRELVGKRAELDRLAQDAELATGDRAELNARVEAARGAVEDLKRQADAAKRAAYASLFRSGSDLDEKHMDALAATVVGDEIVDLVTRTTNLVTLLERLRDAVARGTGGAEAQRRYYGAVVAVQKMALAAQRRYLERIEGRYSPFVDGIVATAGKALEQATELRRSETNPERLKVLEANIKAQKLTMDTARLYKRHLDAQGRQARTAIAESERSLRVAENTRQTVAIGLDLLATITSSDELFKAIQPLQLPVMQPFNSDEIERAFQNLTTQMNGF
jgi:hypothetical protein